MNKQMNEQMTKTPNIEPLKIFLINGLSWGDLEFDNKSNDSCGTGLPYVLSYTDI